MISNGGKSLTNNERSNIPLTSNVTSSPLGELGVYFKHQAHTGIPVSKKLRANGNLPSTEYEQKILSSSLKDYQEHKKRKNLELTNGFNRKKFTFFMEDTYVTVQNYLTLYNSGGELTKQLKYKNGLVNIYIFSNLQNKSTI